MTDNTLDFIHRYEAGTGSLTLLLLHGTGGDEQSLLSIGRHLAPAANLLSPRGKVMENTLRRFFRRLSEGVFDEADVIFRAGELAGFVRRAADEYGFDPGRVVAVGYSNGANIAASLLLLAPNLLAGAVLLRPMVPLVPDAPPDLKGVQVYIAAGREDAVTPPEQAEALAALLRRCGVDVITKWQDAGHKLKRQEFDEARAWLRQHWTELR